MTNADMREFWNGEGGEKWLQFQETTDASLLPHGRKVIAAAALVAGESVLDVGCGCGDTSLRMARRVGPDGRVLGVDISTPIVARAQARAHGRASSAEASNVEFECGDAQVFPFAAAAFDVVVSRFGVMFFDDPVAAFANLRRALRPGGRLAFVCWQPTRDNEWIRNPLEIVANHVPLPAPPGPEEPGPLSLGDPDRVKRILAAAGFSDVGIESVGAPLVIGATVDEAVTFLTRMGPAGSAIARSDADDATKSRIAADLRDALAAHDTGQGVAMGSAVWIVTARSA